MVDIFVQKIDAYFMGALWWIVTFMNLCMVRLVQFQSHLDLTHVLKACWFKCKQAQKP